MKSRLALLKYFASILAVIIIGLSSGAFATTPPFRGRALSRSSDNAIPKTPALRHGIGQRRIQRSPSPTSSSEDAEASPRATEVQRAAESLVAHFGLDLALTKQIPSAQAMSKHLDHYVQYHENDYDTLDEALSALGSDDLDPGEACGALTFRPRLRSAESAVTLTSAEKSAAMQLAMKSFATIFSSYPAPTRGVC